MQLIRFESEGRRREGEGVGRLRIEVANAASGYKGGFTVYTCILDHAYTEGLQIRFVSIDFSF